VKRQLIAALLTGVASLVISGIAAAQSAPAPEPAATPTPKPKPKLFVTGPQFIAVGASAASNVTSEFVPGSSTGPSEIEGWQTGESTLLGHFHVLSYTDYRSFAYEHVAANPVATIGGNGFASVPSFLVHDDEMESGGGPRIAPHVFAGLDLFTRRENSGYPPVHGVGYVLMLAPNPVPVISPYAWVSYTPNAGGLYTLGSAPQTALTYRGTRYRAGVLINEPGTHLYLDVGFAGEDLHDRTNAPAPVRDSMLAAGLGVRF
jgi:hypothetical protein